MDDVVINLRGRLIEMTHHLENLCGDRAGIAVAALGRGDAKAMRKLRALRKAIAETEAELQELPDAIASAERKEQLASRRKHPNVVPSAAIAIGLRIAHPAAVALGQELTDAAAIGLKIACGILNPPGIVPVTRRL